MIDASEMALKRGLGVPKFPFALVKREYLEVLKQLIFPNGAQERGVFLDAVSNDSPRYNRRVGVSVGDGRFAEFMENPKLGRSSRMLLLV